MRIISNEIQQQKSTHMTNIDAVLEMQIHLARKCSAVNKLLPDDLIRSDALQGSQTRIHAGKGSGLAKISAI